MIKIAIIGAGSVTFSKNLTTDILSYPEFRNATLCYMDIDMERLELGANLCRRVARALKAKPRIETTSNRRKAVAGADFVINLVQIGGMGSTLVDFEIPRKYGLKFTIADTTGPGGLFRALRTYPMLKGLCRDMQEVCPQAILLNYSNPMAMNMQTVYRTSGGHLKAVGLCHSVQGTLRDIGTYLGEKPEEIEFVCAGINHMAFYLRLRKGERDLYPQLFANARKPDVYKLDRVRFELMNMLGYFVTESSRHNAEYNAHFIPHGPEVIARYNVPIDEYLKCSAVGIELFELLKKSERSAQPIEVKRSQEYGATIIHSIATGSPSVVYGNMLNNGAIDNLPRTAIVEVPTLVDRAGLQPTTVGDLPPQLVAYVMPHVQQHELFIRAAMEGRRDHVYQAAMADPLTSAMLTLDQIKSMCDELIAGHGKLLPRLNAPTLVPSSGNKFGRMSPETARAHWERVQQRDGADAIINWHVIGPFAGPEAGKIDLEIPTPVDADFLRHASGEVDLKARYRIDGKTLIWKPAQASPSGELSLTGALGAFEWVLAYACATFEADHARDAILRCGSDDGIKIWLNGELVHKNEVARGYIAKEDQAKVRLQAGVNRLLVKTDNYRSGWSIGVFIMPASY